MRVQLIGNKFNKGIVTLEVLIAFTVLVLCMSAVIMMVFGSQSVVVDLKINNEAIAKAQKIIEKARADSRKNLSSVESYNTNETSGSLVFAEKLEVIEKESTVCRKKVTSTVAWDAGFRPQKIELSTILGDVGLALALGGDCVIDPPNSNWNNPDRFASSNTFSTGNPTTLDVLNKIAYMGSNKIPFLEIADTKNASLGQSSGLFTAYMNNFNLGNMPNDIDVVNFSDGKKYAFLAMNTNTNQLNVVDVTNINAPVLAATRSLSACVAGSMPQGWRLHAYGNKLYFLTRYTAGPEFHVFDISNPTNPIEIGNDPCKGFELGDTAEDIEVRDQNIGGNIKRFIYLATDENDKELRVLNVTDSLFINNVNIATQDLPGSQDGQSVYIVGNRLYFGRQSNPSGPDLYVFDIKNPTAGLTMLGSRDIGTGVMGIRVAGPLGFFATPKANKEFQVWDVSNLANIFLVSTHHTDNIADQGIDYESNFVYAIGKSSTPNFQILHNNTQ